MSRRHQAEKREILPDAKFGDMVVTKFMNTLMYEGKKSVAEQIVYDALAIAAERSAKLGGIACEVGPIQNLRLHYRAERYAFSCDEPLVYTVIEAGEFEPGRPSFLHNYNWRLKRFSPAVSGATPTKPTEAAGGE